jgi:5-methylcytosine-specific restriction endonuclease McrA
LIAVKRRSRSTEKKRVETTPSSCDAADAAAAFAASCKERLSPAEGAAILLALTEKKKIPWSLPRQRVVWEALESFCRRYCEPDELARFSEAIATRLAAGRPAVDPARVAAVKWREKPSRPWRRKSRRVPRDADEFLDQQRELASARARRIHQRNQQTKRYRELRTAALAAAGYRCERCGCEGLLELHHKHYATLGAESLADVQMLCRACHQSETERQRALRRARWRPWASSRPRSWR